MTHQEFTERVNLNVGAYYFDHVVHPAYMESNLDKDAWCKLWKKNGGYQNALDWEIMEKNALDYAYEKIKEKNEALEKNIERLTKRNAELEDESKKMTAEIEQLIEISETYSSAELRQLVIDKIGFKAYISYKLEHGKNIWALDREELIKTLSA